MTNDLVGRCAAALRHGALVALALTIEDLILYDHLHGPDDDPVLDLLPYTAGVSTILLGYSQLKATQEQPEGAIEAWIIALCGGAAVTAARAIRRRYQTARRLTATRSAIAGHAAGGRYALEADAEFGAGD